MLLLLISIAWLAVVFFGVRMCRLAARSDEAHDVEMAELIAAAYLAAREASPPVVPDEQLPLDAELKVYRATG
jgi:hypothetical protein